VERQSLEEAGFENMITSVEASPIVQPDADTFTTFITYVICD
jgi:hypothetical protein